MFRAYPTLYKERETLIDWVQRYAVLSMCISFVILDIDQTSVSKIQLVQVPPIADAHGMNLVFQIISSIYKHVLYKK